MTQNLWCLEVKFLRTILIFNEICEPMTFFLQWAETLIRSRFKQLIIPALKPVSPTSPCIWRCKAPCSEELAMRVFRRRTHCFRLAIGERPHASLNSPSAVCTPSRRSVPSRSGWIAIYTHTHTHLHTFTLSYFQVKCKFWIPTYII